MNKDTASGAPTTKPAPPQREFIGMNIYAPAGTKVRAVYKDGKPQNGYDHHKDTVAKHLKEGEWYTVESTDVGNWHTDVYLQEFPKVAFNSACLEQRNPDAQTPPCSSCDALFAEDCTNVCAFAKNDLTAPTPKEAPSLLEAGTTIRVFVSDLSKVRLGKKTFAMVHAEEPPNATIVFDSDTAKALHTDGLTTAHELCQIRSEKRKYHCDVEYLVTGRATVKTRNNGQRYVYEGDTFDLVAVMTIDKDSGIARVNELFPPGTKHYVISLIGTKWHDKMGYELTDIDERDLNIHEVSQPIYRTRLTSL